MNATGSTLMTHAGGRRRTFEELAGLATPERTRTPVPHHELVAELHRGLQGAGLAITRQEFATMGRGDERLFGVMDLAGAAANRPDVGLSLGFRASNDKSMAISVIAAARVFVCDNMAFSGQGGSVFLRAVHGANLQLPRIIPPAIELFLDRSGHWTAAIDRMRDVALTDGRAKELIFDAFTAEREADRPMPLRLLDDVARCYFRDDQQRAKFPDRTLWALNNAFTEVVKTMRPGQQQVCGRRIGQYFSLALGAITGPARGGDGAALLDEDTTLTEDGRGGVVIEVGGAAEDDAAE